MASPEGYTARERPREAKVGTTWTQFYNNDDYPTIDGASITEGGFVNTSSCMSCHVQASVNAQGQLVAGVGGSVLPESSSMPSSEWRGPADLAVVFGLVHQECLLPSRTNSATVYTKMRKKPATLHAEMEISSNGPTIAA